MYSKKIEAISLLKCGQFSDAFSSINSSLLAKPNQKDYLLVKAQILESMGEYSESLKIIEKLKEIDPTNSSLDEAYKRVNQAIEKQKNSNNGMRIFYYFMIKYSGR